LGEILEIKKPILNLVEHLEIHWLEASIHNIQLEEVDKLKVVPDTNWTMEVYMVVGHHSLGYCVELKVIWNIKHLISCKSQVRLINLFFVVYLITSIINLVSSGVENTKKICTHTH